MGKRSKRALDDDVTAGPSNASSPRSAEVSREVMPMQSRENLDLPMYEELSQRCQHLSDQLAAMQEQYATLAQSYGAQSINNNHSNSAASSTPSPVEFVLYKDVVPPLRPKLLLHNH